VYANVVTGRQRMRRLAPRFDPQIASTV